MDDRENVSRCILQLSFNSTMCRVPDHLLCDCPTTQEHTNTLICSWGQTLSQCRVTKRAALASNFKLYVSKSGSFFHRFVK